MGRLSRRDYESADQVVDRSGMHLISRYTLAIPSSVRTLEAGSRLSRAWAPAGIKEGDYASFRDSKWADSGVC